MAGTGSSGKLPLSITTLPHDGRALTESPIDMEVIGDAVILPILGLTLLSVLSIPFFDHAVQGAFVSAVMGLLMTIAQAYRVRSIGRNIDTYAVVLCFIFVIFCTILASGKIQPGNLPL